MVDLYLLHLTVCDDNTERNVLQCDSRNMAAYMLDIDAAGVLTNNVSRTHPLMFVSIVLERGL